MSNDRALVMDRIRAALATRQAPTPAPEYDARAAIPKSAAGRPLVELFTERLAGVRGRLFHSPVLLANWLRGERALRGYCDPELLSLIKPAFGDFRLETQFDRKRIDDYAFGITRALAGIAETGSVILDDTTTSNRLAALAPWIHVAVLARSELFPDSLAALESLGDDPNVVWVTGPSKTADVEGILIEGVHGPGEQVVLMV